MRIRPYLAFGRRQLRVGWCTQYVTDPPWHWRYRWVGVTWQ